MGKISFKGNYSKITTYALYCQGRDPIPSFKMHLKTLCDEWKAKQLRTSHPVPWRWLLKSNLTHNVIVWRLTSNFVAIDVSSQCDLYTIWPKMTYGITLKLYNFGWRLAILRLFSLPTSKFDTPCQNSTSLMRSTLTTEQCDWGVRAHTCRPMRLGRTTSAQC